MEQIEKLSVRQELEETLRKNKINSLIAKYNRKFLSKSQLPEEIS